MLTENPRMVNNVSVIKRKGKVSYEGFSGGDLTM